MTIPIIYLYGEGRLDININNLTNLLMERYCLQNISDFEDSKIYLNGESVDEIIYSKNLDYIKIDCSIEVFNDILFEFVKYLDGSYKFSIGFSGEPEDIKSFPVFKGKQQLSDFCNNMFTLTD